MEKTQAYLGAIDVRCFLTKLSATSVNSGQASLSASLWIGSGLGRCKNRGRLTLVPLLVVTVLRCGCCDVMDNNLTALLALGDASKSRDVVLQGLSWPRMRSRCWLVG